MHFTHTFTPYPTKLAQFKLPQNYIEEIPQREPEHKKQELAKFQTLSKIKLDRFLTNTQETL